MKVNQLLLMTLAVMAAFASEYAPAQGQDKSLRYPLGGPTPKGDNAQVVHAVDGLSGAYYGRPKVKHEPRQNAFDFIWETPRLIRLAKEEFRLTTAWSQEVTIYPKLTPSQRHVKITGEILLDVEAPKGAGYKIGVLANGVRTLLAEKQVVDPEVPAKNTKIAFSTDTQVNPGAWGKRGVTLEFYVQLDRECRCQRPAVLMRSIHVEVQPRAEQAAQVDSTHASATGDKREATTANIDKAKRAKP